MRPEADVRVTLVLLDTVVTDSKGNPIRGIGAEEFELLVDNEIVPIEAVEEFCDPDAGAGAAGQAPIERAAGVPDDEPGSTGGVSSVGGFASPVAVNGAPSMADAVIGSARTVGTSGAITRHYILFFDISHMKLATRRKAIQIATQFVRERMLPTDRAMILAFARGLHLVSGFSSDREFLAARLERMHDDRVLTDASPIQQETDLIRLAGAGRSPRPSSGRGATGLSRMSVMPGVSNPECEAGARIAEIETTRALRAIANTMPAFSDLPGRKALMLFTETLQADPARAYFEACGIPLFERPSLWITVAPEVLHLAHRANLVGVSFYPMHPGGIEAGRMGPVMEQSIAFQKSISLSTGGEAFIVMKNPLVAFEQATRDMSCYYMLAYRVREGMKPGKHTAVVRVARKKVRVRHRESFVLQTHAEASEQQMLAVLSNPGLYRELPVEAKGYTLADAGKGARHFVIQASVPRRELVFLPAAPSGRAGRVHLRGGVISEGKLACEFSGTHDVRTGETIEPAESGVGVQAVCDLREGEYELVVAGRDETGGALGTFWGRFPVQMKDMRNTSGALLWAPASDGSWTRLGEASWLPSIGKPGQPLFIRHSLTLAPGEAGALTFTACREGGNPSTAAAGLAAASIALRGGRSVTLAASPVKSTPQGRCELLRADIAAGSLPPGGYDVVPAVGEPWVPTGSPVRIRIQ